MVSTANLAEATAANVGAASEANSAAATAANLVTVTKAYLVSRIKPQTQIKAAVPDLEGDLSISKSNINNRKKAQSQQSKITLKKVVEVSSFTRSGAKGFHEQSAKGFHEQSAKGFHEQSAKVYS